MQNSEPLVVHIETSIRGRFLVTLSDASGPANLLVGFHGYAENAMDQLGRLSRMADGKWHLCSVQALHPFYTRSDGQIVANWMTRLDRELAIEDNIGYVTRVLETLTSRFGAPDRLVFCGFSQGAAMAYRAASSIQERSWVIAVGGDLPPELTPDSIRRYRGAFLCRGDRDRQYPQSRLEDDLARLGECGVPTRCAVYPGGHQWNEEVDQLASDYLRELPGEP